MDFSGNGAGTGVYTNPSSQQPFQNKMFSSVGYSTATTTPTAATTAMHMDQYRCFPGDVCYSSENGSGNDNGNRDQVKRMSYQPNGIDESGEMKNSTQALGRGYGEMMNGQDSFPSARSGSPDDRRGRKNGSGVSHTTKGKKVANGTSENPSVQTDSLVGGQITFQELTSMHVEPMDFAVRDQTSQVRFISI